MAVVVPQLDGIGVARQDPRPRAVVAHVERDPNDLVRALPYVHHELGAVEPIVCLRELLCHAGERPRTMLR